jgi:hypothetical protein
LSSSIAGHCHRRPLLTLVVANAMSTSVDEIVSGCDSNPIATCDVALVLVIDFTGHRVDSVVFQFVRLAAFAVSRCAALG